MLTPVFELSQDTRYLIIQIKAPYAKISDTEIFVDDQDFKFYSKPYYLRLNLPGPVVEDGREKAKYDTNAGTFTISFPKVNPGQVFEGLDLLTQLLAPSGARSAHQPLIEVIDGIENVVPSEENEQDIGEEEEFDWQIIQEPYSEPDNIGQLETPVYGFGNLRSGVFKRLQEELHDIIDLREADKTPSSQRTELRLADEHRHFDQDYYLSDLYDNDMVTGLLDFQPSWVEEYKKIKGGAKAAEIVCFSDDEKEKMRNLPRKEYILDSITTKKTLLGLVEIIFAWCYNHRTTHGENTVESGWTICKLSGTLSWLENFPNLSEVMTCCYRRCLCYPLYRHWELAYRCLKDVRKILHMGRRQLLKCLLEVHRLLGQSDNHYVLNDLYITDYCVWIQSASSKQLESLYRNLSKIKITKDNIGFDLVALEQAAELAVSEENNADDVADSVASLHISNSDDPSLQNRDVSNSLASQTEQLTISDSTKQNSSNLESHSACLQSQDSDDKTLEVSVNSDTPESASSSDESSEYTTDSSSTDSDEDSDSTCHSQHSLDIPKITEITVVSDPKPEHIKEKSPSGKESEESHTNYEDKLCKDTKTLNF